ncbi:MAG: hypothetical protein IJL18_04295 [Synergistaceae bacterium]|nr:hypothetical protein [Synergistaceae bacterium]
MSIRKLSSILLTTLILFGATSAFATDYKTKITLTVAASSPTYDEVYTFTQPADLTITQSGWNSLGNITASYGGSNAGFDSSKKLVVTVTSTNTFALKAEGIDSTITYFHATSENDTSATTTFEFSAAEINATGGTSKAVGVNVADYSSASAGTYTDEITYSVEVQNAATSLLSLTVYDDYNFYGGNKTFYYVEGETWSQAITNHPTENASWSINGTSVNLSGTNGDVFSSGGAVNANTVIDATKSYSLP